MRQLVAVTLDRACQQIEKREGLFVRKVELRLGRSNRVSSKNALLTVAPILPRKHHPVWNKAALRGPPSRAPLRR